jgi:hypothetical protein
MAQQNQPFELKFPKPSIYNGDPSTYNTWIEECDIYFASLGVANDDKKIYYILGLLRDAAADWKQDWFKQHSNNMGTYADFKTSMESAFAPVQRKQDIERRLRSIKQIFGMDIQTYNSRFAVLKSQSGITDDIVLSSYYAEGLQETIRKEALRQRPTTLEEWKNAARAAEDIAIVENRFRQPKLPNNFRSNKNKIRSKYKRPNPRYAGSSYESPKQRSEWDMDVDTITESINNLGVDNDDDESSEFDGTYSDGEEEDNEDEEINNIRERNSNRRAVDRFINIIFTPDQKQALRRGECFFCHEKGHWVANCPKRKSYLKLPNSGKMDRPDKQGSRSRQKPQRNNFKSRRSSGNFKKRQQPPVVDPNAMVYNMEDEDMDDILEEYSNNNENF